MSLLLFMIILDAARTAVDNVLAHELSRIAVGGASTQCCTAGIIPEAT